MSTTALGQEQPQGRAGKYLFKQKLIGRGRVVDPDPDPYWIRIQLEAWIRIRIRIRNTDPDLDPGGQKLPKKVDNNW